MRKHARGRHNRLPAPPQADQTGQWTETDEAWCWKQVAKLGLERRDLNADVLERAFNRYHTDLPDCLRHQPYHMIDDIQGYGWATADRIGRKMGFKSDDPQRLFFGVLYHLEQSRNEGHVYLPMGRLLDTATRALEVRHMDVSLAVQRLEEADRVVVDGQDVYHADMHEAELGVVEHSVRLQEESIAVPMTEERLTLFCGDHTKLADEQREAVLQTFRHGMLVVTGGPGTGKTTTVRTIVGLCTDLRLKVTLCAPTGRAAKRLSEATDRDASTIHRMLNWKAPNPPEPGQEPKEGRPDPFDVELMIVDEVSMVDIGLLFALMERLDSRTHLLLVGDVDQLPSVGPGQVLRDLIQSDAVPVVRLRTIFRQQEGSGIIVNAHRVNTGLMPQSRDGFYWVTEEDTEQIAQHVVKMAAERLPQGKQMDPIWDVQVLIPQKKGCCGVDAMNVVLRQRLNQKGYMATPDADRQQFWFGDKVMQTKNNYDLEVMNGEMGEVVEVGPLKVRYQGHETDTQYPDGKQQEVRLAYAVTVHKSQGSEFRAVVVPLTMEHRWGMQRCLLYTAVTRAKEVVVVIGQRQAMETAVANTKTDLRYTHLRRRLVERYTGGAAEQTPL